MIPVNVANTSGTLFSQNPDSINKIEGFFITASPAAQRWMQVHDSVTAPATGAVPKKWFPIYGAAEFFKSFIDGELRCSKGIWIGISTTEATFTASTDTADITCELTEADGRNNGTYAFVGDLTTGVNSLIVWAVNDGNALKLNLTRAVIKNNGAATQYVFVSAAAVFPTLPTAKVVKLTILAGATKSFSFGYDGLHPMIINGIQFDGCYLYGSTTITSYTPIADTSLNIQAQTFLET